MWPQAADFVPMELKWFLIFTISGAARGTQDKENDYGSSSDFNCDFAATPRGFSSGRIRGSLLAEHSFNAPGLYSRHCACCLDYRKALIPVSFAVKCFKTLI